METSVQRLQRQIGMGGTVTMIALLVLGVPLYLSLGPERTVVGYLGTVNFRHFVVLAVLFGLTVAIKHSVSRIVQVAVFVVWGLVVQVYGVIGSFTGLAVAGIGVILAAHYGYFQHQTRLKTTLLVITVVATVLLHVLSRSASRYQTGPIADFLYSTVGALALFGGYLLVIRDAAISASLRRTLLEREVEIRTNDLRIEAENRLEAEERARQAADRAAHLAEERLTLLQEVHHRAKNSLQMTLTLLESMEPGSPSDAAATMNRVRAIGLVYDLVDEGEDLSTICLEDYIERLVWHFTVASTGTALQIMFDRRKQEHYTRLDATINLGLLLHEVVQMIRETANSTDTLIVAIEEHATADAVVFGISYPGRSSSARTDITTDIVTASGLLPALVERLHAITSVDRGDVERLTIAVPKDVIVKSAALE